MAKKKGIVTSPAGIASYPRLTHPDTKFDAGGVYKTGLIIGGEDAQKFKAFLDSKIAAVVKQKLEDGEISKKTAQKNVNEPYEVLEDDDGNETGEIQFNFKLKASGKTRAGEEFTQKPALYDAKGKPLAAGDVNVYGGSKLKVACELSEYGNNAIGVGISLRMKAVQIIELVESGGSADSFGFGEEEGFEATSADFSDTSADAEEADEQEEDEDF